MDRALPLAIVVTISPPPRSRLSPQARRLTDPNIIIRRDGVWNF